MTLLHALVTVGRFFSPSTETARLQGSENSDRFAWAWRRPGGRSDRVDGLTVVEAAVRR